MGFPPGLTNDAKTTNARGKNKGYQWGIDLQIVSIRARSDRVDDLLVPVVRSVIFKQAEVQCRGW